MNLFRRDRVIAFGIVAVCIAILPALIPSYGSFEMTYVAAYAIAILGLIVLTGKNGQISLGHGAFMALGGYTVAILSTRAGLPYWVGIPAAAIISGLIGIAIGLVALRLEGVYLALATFALAVSVPSILKRFGGLTGGSGGIVLNPIVPPSWVPIDSERWFYYIAWAIAGALCILTAFLLDGRLGRSLMALRDNETAAISFGVNPFYYKTLAFAWSAAFAGISGALLAIATAFVSPDAYGFNLSITILIGAVLGGLGSLWGAALGGLVVEFLPLWAQTINKAAPSVVYGVALIVVMLVMPGGIAGGIIRLFRSRRPRDPVLETPSDASHVSTVPVHRSSE